MLQTRDYYHSSEINWLWITIWHRYPPPVPTLIVINGTVIRHYD